MKKTLFVFACGVLTLSLLSCAKKKNDTTIITHRVVQKAPTQIKTIGDYKQTREVEWLGTTYTVEYGLQADKSLSTVAEGTQKYYDNRVIVRIIRKDGSEFFNKAFTKSDFTSYIDSKYAKSGALLGVVFNKVEGDYLYFAASVGSPDKLSDVYVPLVVKVSRFGDVTISKDAMLDTDNGSATTDEMAAEEDVV